MVEPTPHERFLAAREQHRKAHQDWEESYVQAVTARRRARRWRIGAGICGAASIVWSVVFLLLTGSPAFWLCLIVGAALLIMVLAKPPFLRLGPEPPKPRPWVEYDENGPIPRV